MLLEAALEGEVLASGGRHADNLAASLLGGFTIVRCHEPLDVIRLEMPSAFRFVVVLPDRKSTRLNSSHRTISYAVFCLKKKMCRRGACVVYMHLSRQPDSRAAPARPRPSPASGPRHASGHAPATPPRPIPLARPLRPTP